MGSGGSGRPGPWAMVPAMTDAPPASTADDLGPEDPRYWCRRWEEGRTGWHRDEVNPKLVRHHGRLTGGQATRVFVPLCGRSLDVGWLHEQGHEVIGIDAAEPAVRGLFARPPAERRDGALTFLHDGRLHVACGDFFALRPEQVGPVACVYDRGSLVALPPPLHERYARHLARFLAPGGRVLLIGLSFDDSRVTGPPFSVPEARVRELFPDFEVEILERDGAAEPSPPFREAGVATMEEATYLLTRRS